MDVFWLVFSAVGGWVVLVNAYASSMHAKAIMESGEEIHWSFLYPIMAFAIPGWILDVVFNVLSSRAVFREGIRCWTFSARVQHHYRFSDGWRYERARWWGLQLNKFDPNHIRNLDGTPVK